MLPENKLASVKAFARLFLIKFIRAKVRFLLKLMLPLFFKKRNNNER
jgi:hypothetical protein